MLKWRHKLCIKCFYAKWPWKCQLMFSFKFGLVVKELRIKCQGEIINSFQATLDPPDGVEGTDTWPSQPANAWLYSHGERYLIHKFWRMSLLLATSNSQTDIEHLMSSITLFVNGDVQIGLPQMFWKAHTNPIPTWSRWPISSNLRGPRASSPRSVLYQQIILSTEDRRLWHALSWSWDNILPCSSLYISTVKQAHVSLQATWTRWKCPACTVIQHHSKFQMDGQRL